MSKPGKFSLYEVWFDGGVLAETIRGMLTDGTSKIHPVAAELLAYNLGYFDARHLPDRKLDGNEHYKNAREQWDKTKTPATDALNQSIRDVTAGRKKIRVKK